MSTEAESKKGKPPEPPSRPLGPQSGLTAEQAEAERVRRLTAAELNTVLANKRCRHCATVGAWEVYDQDRRGKRVRYVRCRGCGHCDQAAVIVRDSPTVSIMAPNAPTARPAIPVAKPDGKGGTHVPDET